jgi:hypothetical protein
MTTCIERDLQNIGIKHCNSRAWGFAATVHVPLFKRHDTLYHGMHQPPLLNDTHSRQLNLLDVNSMVAVESVDSPLLLPVV